MWDVLLKSPNYEGFFRGWKDTVDISVGSCETAAIAEAQQYKGHAWVHRYTRKNGMVNNRVLRNLIPFEFSTPTYRDENWWVSDEVRNSLKGSILQVYRKNASESEHRYLIPNIDERVLVEARLRGIFSELRKQFPKNPFPKVEIKPLDSRMLEEVMEYLPLQVSLQDEAHPIS